MLMQIQKKKKKKKKNVLVGYGQKNGFDQSGIWTLRLTLYQKLIFCMQLQVQES